MRCTRCGRKACLEIRRHRAAFCPEHLLEHLRSQVARAIVRFRMVGPEDRLLVAVSGGKDSLALWDILLELGYQAEGLYIDLGIGNYSVASREKVRDFASARAVVFREVSLPQIYGVGIEHIASHGSSAVCAVCGVVKRYIMNLVAARGGYVAIATGHNLDDEAAALLGNLLHWQVGYLSRQSPCLATEPGLVRRIKPLCRLTERETSAYCLLNGIGYILEECPFSRGAKSLLYKEVLNQLEAAAPGTKDQFYLGFLRYGGTGFGFRSEEATLRPCNVCGQPTTAGTCRFCRQMARAGLEPLTLQAALG